ncbi:MAG: hypothetical protein ACKV2U_33820 [Bryobacteraceae bacterium]
MSVLDRYLLRLYETRCLDPLTGTGVCVICIQHQLPPTANDWKQLLDQAEVGITYSRSWEVSGGGDTTNTQRSMMQATVDGVLKLLEVNEKSGSGGGFDRGLFAHYIVGELRIPFEQSDLNGFTIFELLIRASKLGFVAVGMATGVLAPEQPVFMVTIPSGIILIAAAQSLGHYLQNPENRFWERLFDTLGLKALSKQAGGKRAEMASDNEQAQ